jgi:hypothetical protein
MPQIQSIRSELSKVKEQITSAEAERLRQKHEDDLWAHKFERAASMVVRIGPTYFISIGNISTNLSGVVFPDPRTRHRIETFLVEQVQPNLYSMRTVSDEQLRRQAFRQAVDETLKCLEEFKEQHSDLYARYLAD